MDANRFDFLAKVAGTGATRRTALSLLAGLGLGPYTLTLREAEARKSGKCKPKCNECEKCKRGDCDKKNGKKRCSKGKCKPKAAGTPCTVFPGGACQNGTCVNLSADEANCGSLGTACGPTQVCQTGSCFPSSTCAATTTSSCGPSSTVCNASGPPNSCTCSRSTEGNVVCVANFNCLSVTPCASSATCPAGEACVDISICCGGSPTHVCLAPCPNPA
jgi:hypothetical protein